LELTQQLATVVAAGNSLLVFKKRTQQLATVVAAGNSLLV
jgi:hypothetical protein